MVYSIYQYLFVYLQSALTCLESGDFLQIRNALIVLNKVGDRSGLTANMSRSSDSTIIASGSEAK